MNTTLQIHPSDNICTALTDLAAGSRIKTVGKELILSNRIPAKHKFNLGVLEEGDDLIMYGGLVGRASRRLDEGTLLTVENVQHAAGSFIITDKTPTWIPPDFSRFASQTFDGYLRSDGQVGTANYWIVVPMVFCENRNLEVLQEALTEQLGYGKANAYKDQARQLVKRYQAGDSAESMRVAHFEPGASTPTQPLFKNVDGIKFLTHNGGCGGTRADAQALCGLLAGYITHPNVAGATVLSLGCQNAQVSMLLDEIDKRSPGFDKPLHLLDQQAEETEANLLSKAVAVTFTGLMEADNLKRQPVPLSKLCIGLECGGSDGFSGISANPAMGYASDLLVALGGSVILAEFPELCGVEQNIIDRCKSVEGARRFSQLMKAYSDRAEKDGSGFDMNPSPGNIKDGLITDAMKSAGAAKKGGTSPISAVLDYPEKVTAAGLNLLCTPGNDVESTSAEVGAGANLILFSTGLGTPTGNPIVPVVKISSNTKLFERMHDIIDLNTGTITEGTETPMQAGERILAYAIEVASGRVKPAAVRNGQNDFIPWKRGTSL